MFCNYDLLRANDHKIEEFVELSIRSKITIGKVGNDENTYGFIRVNMIEMKVEYLLLLSS